VLGHIDAMKVFFPGFSDIRTPAIDEAFQAIAESGAAIEINTSGRAVCGSWYPSDDILERALHYGVAVTFGSDAHTPVRVADQCEQVRSRLKEIGFTEWAFYRRRQKQVVAL
jgi:histidinol-phosphatase (PHP family)